MGRIATQAEWKRAKELLAQYEGKSVHSGAKFSAKYYPGLNHSFLLLKDKKNQEKKLISLSRHYYLGSGAFGKVKLAEDEQGNLYALKIIPASSEHEFENEMFECEKEVLRSLKTSSFSGEKVGGLTKSTEQQKQKFYILEKLANGITLEEYLACCVLNEDQKKCIAYRLISAIRELHEKNIIHNDIRPANIMVSISENGIPMIELIDFGGSQALEKGKSEYIGFNIGARKYVAPEANQDRKSVLSVKSDIYSLGVVLKKDLHLQSSFFSTMCSREPNERLSLDKVLQQLKSSEAVKLPASNFQDRLCKKYKIAIEDIKSDIENKIRTCDAGKNEEKEQLLDYLDNSIDDKVHSLADLMTILVQKRKTSNVKCQFSLKEIKRELLGIIQRMVRLTDSIEQLHEFFDYLRSSEYQKPILRRERRCLMGTSGMTSSWKEALDIFKVRAMEIAHEKVSLGQNIENANLFQNIFSTSRARIPKVQPTRAVEFERLLRS